MNDFTEKTIAAIRGTEQNCASDNTAVKARSSASHARTSVTFMFLMIMTFSTSGCVPLLGNFARGFEGGRERAVARTLINKGKNQEAIEHLNKANEIYPVGQTYALMGMAYENLHDYDHALTALQKAEEMMTQDRPTQALAKLKAVQEPNFGFVYSHISTVYHAQKKLDLAKEFIDKALEVEPRNALHHRYRAAVCFELGDTPKAIEDATKAIEIEPKVAVYYKARASYELQAKQYENALADCNTGLAIDPGNASLTHLKSIADRAMDTATKH